MDDKSLTPSLPANWYYDEAHFSLEKENIFKKEWIFLCHSQEVPEAKDYITCDVAGIPIIVLRDENKKIQVLLNVCRHRAAPLLTEKKGHLDKPIIICQYHGWCYLTDGSFKQAPFMTPPCEGLNLKKITHTEARGMVFISFNTTPYSFEKRKEAIFQEMDKAQFKIENYTYNRQITRQGNFNWKTWIEGFQECYHCPTIHAGFNKDFHLSKYEVHNKDHFSVHSCPRKEKSSTGSFEGLWLWLYPNCGLPCYEKVYYTLRINPVSATKTDLIYTFFTNEQINAQDEATFFDFVTKITDEDIVICERVQKNLEDCAGENLFDHGYLNMTRENGVHYFHELIRRALEPANLVELVGKHQMHQEYS